MSVAVTELVALAEFVAESGVAQDDLLGFIEMTAKAVTAWGVKIARRLNDKSTAFSGRGDV